MQTAEDPCVLSPWAWCKREPVSQVSPKYVRWGLQDAFQSVGILYRHTLRLNKCLRISHSCLEHVFSRVGQIPLGPAAFLSFCGPRSLLTWDGWSIRLLSHQIRCCNENTTTARPLVIQMCRGTSVTYSIYNLCHAVVANHVSRRSDTSAAQWTATLMVWSQP